MPGAMLRFLEAAPRYAALARSQWWAPERLAALRERRLARTLAAAARIPFYAERLGGPRRPDELASLPPLERADVAALARSVRSVHPPETRFAAGRSSGTSGPAAQFLFDARHQRGRNAARARYLRTNGWSPLERTVWFVGARLLTETDPAYASEGELIRGSARLGVRFESTLMPFAEQVAVLERHRAESVYSYPSGIDGILRILEAEGRRLPDLRRALCGGETVDEALRERSRRNFGFDLRDNWGSTEAFLAFECPAGSYHVNAEHVVVEIVDAAGRAVAPGTMGRTLVTTLENELMPLVRYAIGDYAVAAAGPCRCGRSLPRIARVLGREMNLFRRADGSLHSSWAAMGVLRHYPEMTLFQIVQEELERFRVRYVAPEPLAGERRASLEAELRTDLGASVEIAVERVAEIPRAPSGKFMLALSEVERGATARA